MKGDAKKLLEELPNSPTAVTLDAIVGEMRSQLANFTDGWTPALMIANAQSFIDAELRLGNGGDMKGVATQVAAMMLITLEKLELET